MSEDTLFDTPASVEGGHAGGATFDETGCYRYDLRREIGDGPWIGWVMLNPSTADATKLDPTLRRVARYSRDWGYGGFYVRNLFALRTTDPAGLREVSDPIGPDNDEWLRSLVTEVETVIVGWGTGRYPRLGRPERWQHVADILAPAIPACLATAKDGQPCHPLYQKADLTPVRWPADNVHAKGANR